MTTSTKRPLPAHLQDVTALASLLERMEREPLRASAAQFRDLARRLSLLLDSAEPGAELDAMLQAFPATAELYENLRYASAGLCRAPLERSLNAELAATRAINRARLGH